MTEIAFPKTRYDALGASGYTASCGVAICALGDEVLLEPITSRGTIGRARLVIPLSHLRQVRDALDAILVERDTP